jgi:hypothetical protein
MDNVEPNALERLPRIRDRPHLGDTVAELDTVRNLLVLGDGRVPGVGQAPVVNAELGWSAGRRWIEWTSGGEQSEQRKLRKLRELREQRKLRELRRGRGGGLGRFARAHCGVCGVRDHERVAV